MITVHSLFSSEAVLERGAGHGPHPGRGGTPQTACKPGSVRGPEPARRSFLWDTHRCVPRATNPDDEAGAPPARHGCRRLSSLFGLAPGGVYPAAAVAGSAVRSCRTVSPLPATRVPSPWAGAGPHAVRAVCFLWHCPWGRPRRPLAGTVLPWSPDFPPPRRSAKPRRDSDRPAVWRADPDRRPAIRQAAGPAGRRVGQEAAGRDERGTADGSDAGRFMNTRPHHVGSARAAGHRSLVTTARIGRL